MRYEGIVYRPPSEARSLIVQVTIGCAHNTCTFCNMYKAKDFRVRSMEEIMEDLKEAHNSYGAYVQKDISGRRRRSGASDREASGNFKGGEGAVPQLHPCGVLRNGQDILRKSEEELKSLQKAGLGIVYVGAESGDDEILASICKGVTAEELKAAGQKLKRCGIQTSVTLISGLGGRSKVEEHARSCAELISAMNPEYASFLTLRLYEGTPMYDDVVTGRFERITADEIVDEMKIFLEHVDSPGTVFRTNHASNYVVLAGNLNEDIPSMLAQLDEAKKTHHYRRFRETGDL